MHRFEVWSPGAKLVSVRSGAGSLRMQRSDDGWWRVQIESAGPGDNYGFLLDDDPTVYPDPRSQWQPDGVHALSRVYDQTAFRWTDQQFQAHPLASAVIYELHVGTFTAEGTLDSAIGKLDHLRELGITHVELMPVAAFSGKHGW